MAKILVVEDDPAAAKDIQSLLVDSGYEVVIAGTGGEGLETAKSHTDFSLVIFLTTTILRNPKYTQ